MAGSPHGWCPTGNAYWIIEAVAEEVTVWQKRSKVCHENV